MATHGRTGLTRLFLGSTTRTCHPLRPLRRPDRARERNQGCRSEKGRGALSAASHQPSQIAILATALACVQRFRRSGGRALLQKGGPLQVGASVRSARRRPPVGQRFRVVVAFLAAGFFQAATEYLRAVVAAAKNGLNWSA